jgi:hypothetical protein
MIARIVTRGGTVAPALDAAARRSASDTPST